jgi:hypothetical protein
VQLVEDAGKGCTIADALLPMSSANSKNRSKVGNTLLVCFELPERGAP